jgi:hypothetical protein
MKRAVTLENIADLIVSQGETIITYLENRFDNKIDALDQKLESQLGSLRSEMSDFRMEVRSDIAGFKMDVVPRLDGLESEIQAVHSDLGEIYCRLDNIEGDVKGIKRRMDGKSPEWSF